MKKYIYSFFLMGMAATVSLSAAEISAPYIIQVTEMSEEMIQAFLNGEIQNATIEFLENTHIPFKQVLRGNFINFVPEEIEPVYLKIVRTFYVKADGYSYLFSTDMQTWKPMMDFLKIEGSLSFVEVFHNFDNHLF